MTFEEAQKELELHEALTYVQKYVTMYSLSDFLERLHDYDKNFYTDRVAKFAKAIEEMTDGVR